MTPWAPLKPCLVAGCALKRDREGQCAVHGTGRWPEDRPNAGQRGYGHRWRQIRAVILARDPICRICHRAPSVQCDHIIARSAGGDDSAGNLRGVCKRCHDSRTGRQGRLSR